VSGIETLRIERSESLGDLFVVAGSRAYLIGSQDGGFPAIGWHNPGDMGGIWAHPIKLFDGVWLAIDGVWLSPATRYVGEACSAQQEYELAQGLCVVRHQFVPDDLPEVIVRYAFTSPEPRTLHVRILARSDLQHVWPTIENDQDTARYLDAKGVWLCADSVHPWYAAVGAVGRTPIGHDFGAHLEAPGLCDKHSLAVTLDYEIDVPAGSPTDLTLLFQRVDGTPAAGAGSREALNTALVQRGHDTTVLWEQKRDRYGALLAQSVLAVPDSGIEGAWDWIKCNYDWLRRDVPGIGSGIGGGLAFYPWWFGADGAYSLLGALALGQHEAAIATYDLLRNASERAHGTSGRVVHEISTSGVVAFPGTTQETPEYVLSLWEAVRWTGDRGLLERSYDFCREGLLNWTLGACTHDDDLLPYGFGITERAGMDMQCVDTASYTAEALSALAGMAQAMGDRDTEARCRTLRTRITEQINQEFWMEDEGLYGDMLATPAEITPRVEAWLHPEESIYYHAEEDTYTRALLHHILEQAQTAHDPERKRAWLLKFWIVISPIEWGLAPPDRAAIALRRLESPEFSGRWGLHISSMYGQEIMSISTGVMATAEARYGRSEQALRYLHALSDALPMDMPGAISELLPTGGCFLQAWSGYALVWPVVRHFFGIQPDALNRTIHLTPCFPRSWPEAHLTNVRIGDTYFDFHWDGADLAVGPDRSEWTITHDPHPAPTVQR
jgi:glycogen debranching enzyme